MSQKTAQGCLLRTGTYLPVTAVLGGLLYAQPEGYKEARRDVIRLSSDLRELQKQQGYATCEPLDNGVGADISPMYCSFLVIPAQVFPLLLQQPSWPQMLRTCLHHLRYILA